MQMKSSLPLIFLISSLLATIILLSADDKLVDVIAQHGLNNVNESVMVEKLHDNGGAVRHLSPINESVAVESEKHIDSSVEQQHDESLVQSLPNEIPLSLNLSNGIEKEDDHIEPFNDIDVTLEMTYNEENIDRADDVQAKEQSQNTTSSNCDNSSNVAHSDGEFAGSGGDSSQVQGSDHETSSIIGEDDEADSQQTRIFVDYASKHSGANIIDKSKDFQGTSNLLVDDDDRYAISPCDIGNGGTKYVIVALSEDILVKTIKLLSYERYSSQTKQFQVHGSQTYPISTKWVDLGTFTAKPWYNTNGQQTFELEQGVWARYLKFRFLSHYGNEFYCTLSQIKVHGSTTLQDFHEVRWDAVEDFEEGALDDTASITGDLDPVGKNLSFDALREADDIVPDQLHHAAVLDSNDDREATPKATVEDAPTINTTSPLENNVPHSVVANENTVISLSVPTTKRSEEDSRYTTEFYQNILLMSKNTFQTIYGAAENDQCLDGAALLAASTKPRAYETAFRNVGNFTPRLESSTRSIIATRPSNKSSMMYDAVNSAVMSVVKISPISDALKGIQRILHVDVSQDSMTPRKRTQTVIIGVANLTLQNDEDEQLNQTFSYGDRIEAEKLNITHESNDDKSQRSPIEQKHETREKYVHLQIAECLGRLNLQELKIKAVKTGVKGGGGPSSVNEPIFKKLADEIKTLQLNQGVYEQFIKLATACYYSVITEVMNDMLVLETNIEQRFSQIEKSLLTTAPSNDRWTWLNLCVTVLRSLGDFLRNTFLEYYSFTLSIYQHTRVSLWLWGKRTRDSTTTFDFLAYFKGAMGLKFDVLSFLVGFIMALCIMIIFTRRKHSKISRLN